MHQPDASSSQPAPSLERFSIHSRRYLGAKSRLLDFLVAFVDDQLGPFQTFGDLFSGTGVVAHAFNRPSISVVANDLLRCNTLSLRCFLTSSEADLKRIPALLAALSALPTPHENYVSTHFGDRFFTQPNALLLGEARATIAAWRQAQHISDAEEAILITCLLYAADRVANTCGHYDAYRTTLDPHKPLELRLPEVRPVANAYNQVFEQDANRLVGELELDILYLDPPYNSRQYSDTYHLLENLARWEQPAVFGKARKMDRSQLKSDYCGRKATRAFAQLIEQARCRHILVSYNNMGSRGNVRSNACISDPDLRDILASRGRVSIEERAFPAFSTGLRTLEGHTERLFWCKVDHLPAAQRRSRVASTVPGDSPS